MQRQIQVKRSAAIRVAAVSLWFAAAMVWGVVPAAAEQPQMQPVSYEQWTAQLQEYAPDLVVVDFWATWCVPCIERFPKMVELHQTYGDRVQFVSLSLDDAEDPAAVAQANDFLSQVGAPFDHYLMRDNMLEAFERLDLLGIPAVILYKGGKEVQRLTGDNPNNQFSDADIEAAIQTWLQKPAP